MRITQLCTYVCTIIQLSRIFFLKKGMHCFSYSLQMYSDHFQTIWLHSAFQLSHQLCVYFGVPIGLLAWCSYIPNRIACFYFFSWMLRRHVCQSFLWPEVLNINRHNSKHTILQSAVHFAVIWLARRTATSPSGPNTCLLRALRTTITVWCVHMLQSCDWW